MKGFETSKLQNNRTALITGKKECPAMKGFETRLSKVLRRRMLKVRRNAPL